MNKARSLLSLLEIKDKVFYHISPKSNRDSIFKYGIDYRKGGQSIATHAWQGGEANYLWKQEWVAYEEAESRGWDLYKVLVPASNVRPDPEDPKLAALTKVPILPNKVRRISLENNK